MKLERATNLISLFEQLSGDVESLTASLRSKRASDGSSFALDTAAPPQSEPLIDLLSRLRTIASLGRILKPDAISALASDGEIDGLSNAVQTSLNSIKSLNSQITSRETISAINSEAFVFQDPQNNTIDLRGGISELYNSCERILQFASFLQRFKRAKQDKSMLTLHTSLSELIKSINKDSQLTRKYARDSETLISQQSAAVTDTEARLKEAQRLLEQTSSDRKTVQEYAAESTNHLAAIRESADDTKELMEAISNYSSQFEQLKKDMDERREEIRGGREAVGALVKELDPWRSEIDGLIHRGEEMLSFTTTAGLAANYASLVQSLTKELGKARLGFYVGIVILFVSAAPLFAHALLPIIALFSTTTAQLAKAIAPAGQNGGWEYVAQVFGRLVILVPAAWLVSFSARRYSSLFKLREHYAYKYSLAASVQGFKKEAPKYGEEIAATIFSQLAFNPADKLDDRDLETHKPPNPLLQRLLAMFDTNQSDGSKK